MPLDQETGIEFPFLQRDLMNMFGDPRDDISGFERDYLKNIDLTDLPGFDHVRDYEGNAWSGRIYGNYVMEGPLRKAFGLIANRGLQALLHTYDGCFNPRPMKSGNMPSMHTWGMALDFNALTNPFRRDGRLVTDFPPEFVMCFAEAGFEWGGIWNKPKDAMHFQLPWQKYWQPGERGPLTPVPFVRDA
jgi:hypothetical protein